MKVVKNLEHESLEKEKRGNEPNQHEQSAQQEQISQHEKLEHPEQQKKEQTAGFVRIKKFHFVMLLLLFVFLTASITTFALTFKDDKVVVIDNGRDDFEKLYSVFDTIKEEYYKDVNPAELIDGAINGMIEALDDPYSDYMSKAETSKFHQSVDPSFEGIGAEIQEKDGHIMIVTPIKGSPAEKAGLKPNDLVISVDGKSLQGKSSTEAVALIRGKKGTKVELAVQRKGVEEPLKISIIRDKIPQQTVYTEMRDDGIVIASIRSFSPNTTQELIDDLNEMNEKGMKGVIIDVRHNPGGLLDQAINISSLFIPKGQVLFQVEHRDGTIEEYKSMNKNPLKIPVAVVIDNGSASASEILAAALAENLGVPVVGEKSFGKGTVQRAHDFPDGSNIKFTTEKWLTPKGNWIHQKGIKPDFEVKLPDYASLSYIDPEKEWKENMSSEEIKAAQKMLNVLGYKPGREDGFFDTKTRQAIISFQKAEKLEPNGILSGKTTMILMTRLGEQIDANDTQIKKAIEVLKQKINSK